MTFPMNENELPPNTRQIPLTKGYVALVDEADYLAVSTMSWHVLKSKGRSDGTLAYAQTTLRGAGGKRALMHRFLMKPPEELVIDHINGDGLDNRRANLRICTHAQNIANQRPQARWGAFKGVYRISHCRWNVRICAAGKRLDLGMFSSEIAAATAYDDAARELHGEYARLNFPDGPPALGVGSGL